MIEVAAVLLALRLQLLGEWLRLMEVSIGSTRFDHGAQLFHAWNALSNTSDGPF